MKAYVLIKISPGEIQDAVRSIRAKKNVLETSMTFGPYDAVPIVEADNLNELGNIISLSIQCIPGVLETLTCLAVEA